jgi:sugar phosphate isomerase/epimerase
MSTAPLYKISLAEWSLHNMLFAGELDNLNFPQFSKEKCSIDAVEYVNQFFKEKDSESYNKELLKRSEDAGVKNVLIMVDGEGPLGSPDENVRRETVDNHKKWIYAAKTLGCHCIRVNAQSEGTYEDQQKYAAEGLRLLCEVADQHGIDVIVENHGGLSSNGEWLAGVIKRVDHPRAGTLPDFGNFRIAEGEWYDRYQGMKELMPYAKGVSAKSHDFDADGKETGTDFFKMLQIIKESGYQGYIDVEYEGKQLPELDGVIATRKLLERAIASVS